ncbi:interferon-induced GTP-binding protein Mx2 [Coniochaeta sp. PMI_546]|nr:interferon-induced GTP-binding protein Mx2 [Coniochaeta sp. PMI_546]
MGSLADGSSVKVEQERGGLGNQSLLDKIDKLRAINIGTDIPLPQLVVVGDQSSGKSSVLESLTGFSFPRAAGLCTRYATQITSRREAQQYIDISIIPRPSASEAEKQRLRAFARRVEAGEDVAFAKIFEDANREMGIRALNDETSNGDLSTFSEDILKVEICGPDQIHLTVIDVPGIFRTATPGLTTEEDIELIRMMVKNYMKDPRTIILAVVPCNVDIATQEILELAKTADPKGMRTMGVLTKPDLAIERATQQAVLDLVLGKRNDLKLGYCVVKNRDADDQDSSIQQRHDKEKAFFRNDPWCKIANSGRTGIDALKDRLRELLVGITKKEFPNVKAEINNRLRNCKEQLKGYGAPRADSQAQRSYLGRLANDFQKIVAYALEANYVHASIFEDKPEMRLITRIISLNEGFAHELWKRGHARKFLSESGKDNGDNKEGDSDSLFDLVAPEKYPELEGIIAELEECEPPSDESLMDHIKLVYERSRGPELGTFGSAILGTVFKEQSKKWRKLVMSHVSRAILLVHDFIVQLLQDIVTDQNVRNALWEDCLFDRLCAAYKRAMRHANFLLDIELSAKPYTYNKYFSANLNKFKLHRIEKHFADKCQNFQFYNHDKEDYENREYITLDQLRRMTVDKDNAVQVQEGIHDILCSYYKVARKRFVDSVCQQAVDRYLLCGKPGSEQNEKGPLAVFDSDLVLALDENKLENIAGEDPWTKQQRESLSAEIKNLMEATKVLRD